MKTATIISLGDIGKIDVAIGGISAISMIGIVMGFDLDESADAVLALSPISAALFALLRWKPLHRPGAPYTRGNFLRA